MTSKDCTKCKTKKPLSLFHKNKARKDGYLTICKNCSNKIISQYHKTQKGLITKIYGTQRCSSRKRSHPHPSYSLKQLREWFRLQSNFDLLYKNWVESGHNKMLAPSCDRINDYLPYTIDNIKLVTWDENNKKGCEDKKNGINNKQNRVVIKLTKEGIIAGEYYSISQANRETGATITGIHLCCTGRQKTAGGYVWCFA